MLKTYRDHVAERAVLGIPPLPLSPKQTGELIELLKNPPKGEEATLLELITHRVPAGVDDAAKVKASYLAAVAHGTEKCTLLSAEKATELLGTMLGGYNLTPLIDLLDHKTCAPIAAQGLKKTLLMFDQFHDGQETQALTKLLDTLEIIELNRSIAQTGGLIRRDFGKSHGLGLNDALIAATAIHAKACLYTLNIKHYPSLSKNQVAQPYRKA